VRVRQVTEFWRCLEADTNARARGMFRSINRKLEALSRAIEASVAEGLQVNCLSRRACMCRCIFGFVKQRPCDGSGTNPAGEEAVVLAWPPVGFGDVRAPFLGGGVFTL
jgi:hypothetical protein